MISIYNYKIFLFVNKIENINKFLFNNTHQLPKLDKLILNCSINNKSLESYSKSLILIEIISLLKSFSIIKRKYYKGRKNIIVFFTPTCFIRKNSILNIIYYFIFFIKPNLKKKMIKFIKNININNVVFLKLIDTASLPGFSQNFDKFKIIINFYLSIKNIKNKFKTKKILNILGF